MKRNAIGLAGLALALLILPACSQGGIAQAAWVGLPMPPAAVQATVTAKRATPQPPRKITLTPHVTAMGGAVFDRDGNLLVGDADADFVYKFDPNGKLLMKIGGHGKGDGQFQFWNDAHQANGGYMAVDAQGSIFVADTGNHRIQKFDSKGKFLKQWGKFGYKDNEFNEPYAISTDGQGNVYVSEMQAWRVQKFSNDGKFITVIAKQGPKNVGEQPWLCNAVDLTGNVYIASFSGQVHKFDPTGKQDESWGKNIKGIKAGFHLITDNASNLYVSDATPRVVKIDPQGKVVGSFVMPSPYPLESAAVATAIDAKGQLYIGFNSWTGKVWDTSLFVYQPSDLKPIP